MAICQHCGLNDGDGFDGGFWWCPSCVAEEGNLLNSLELRTSRTASPLLYPDDDRHLGYRGWRNWFGDHDCVEKLETIPRKA